VHGVHNRLDKSGTESGFRGGVGGYILRPVAEGVLDVTVKMLHFFTLGRTFDARIARLGQEQAGGGSEREREEGGGRREEGRGGGRRGEGAN
jgi:hypothetical protein